MVRYHIYALIREPKDEAISGIYYDKNGKKYRDMTPDDFTKARFL